MNSKRENYQLFFTFNKTITKEVSCHKPDQPYDVMYDDVMYDISQQKSFSVPPK